MPGFTTDNKTTSKDSSPRVVFTLKSSVGREIKTYTVPVENADIFEATLRQEEPKIRQDSGETDPLMLIRIDRCF